MSTPTFEEIQQDTLAYRVARAVVIANDAASARGLVPEESLLTITEEPSSERELWRIHYGPRDYLDRRGGDLTIVVDEVAGSVRQIIRGQ